MILLYNKLENSMKRSRSGADLRELHIQKQLKRVVHAVEDGRNGTHTEVKEEIQPSSEFVEERIVDEGEGEPQGNGTPTKETGATSSNFVQERAVDEGDDHEEPGFTSIDHEERGADEGEHQTDATPSHLREEGGATSSEIVKERVVDEDDELREEAKVSSSAQTHEEKVVDEGVDHEEPSFTSVDHEERGADEGEHQTDATLGHLREEGDATSSEIVEKEQY
ncbi:hypothetical protein LguiB_021467 [Lonicera macranthoides]